jgi:hypothetical protein
MKLKNVSLIELHIEKIILGVVGVYALAVIWLFMLGNPYKAKIAGESVARTPVDVEKMLLDEAESVEKLVAPGSKSQLPLMPVPDYFAKFQKRLGEPTLKSERLAWFLGDPGIKGGGVDDIPPIHVDDRSPPAPIEVKVASGHGVMDVHTDGAMDQAYITLAGLIPTAPRDFRYVSIAANFPQSVWKDLVDTKWDIDGSRRYWIKLKTILDVVLERQTLDPISKKWGVYRDGEFVPDMQIEGQRPDGTPIMGIMVDGKFVPGGAMVDEIAPLPDTVSIREYRKRRDWTDWEQNPDEFGQWRIDFDKHVREFGSQVTEMRFPPLAPGVGPRQIEPGENRKDWDQADIDQVYDLNQQINKAERGLLKIGGPDALKNLDFSKIRVPEKTPTRGSTTGGRFRPNQFSSSGGDFVRPPRPTVTRLKRPSTTGARPTKAGGKTDAAAAARKKKLIEIKRASLMKLMQEKAIVYDKYAPKEEAIEGPGAGTETRRKRDVLGGPIPGEVEPIIEVLPDIPLLAHDLSVEPGMSYRYRIRVAVLKPLFHNKTLQDRVIERNFNHVAKLSDPSEWSKQVRVLPRSHFFVVGATGGDTKPEAKVEIWHLFNGKWYRSEFSVKPGQLIGGKVLIAVNAEQDGEVELNVPMIMVGLETAAGANGTTIDRGRKKFLYLDLKTNQLLERDPKDDRNNDMRKRLLTESEEVARRP